MKFIRCPLGSSSNSTIRFPAVVSRRTKQLSGDCMNTSVVWMACLVPSLDLSSMTYLPEERNSYCRFSSEDTSSPSISHTNSEAFFDLFSKYNLAGTLGGPCILCSNAAIGDEHCQKQRQVKNSKKTFKSWLLRFGYFHGNIRHRSVARCCRSHCNLIDYIHTFYDFTKHSVVTI